MALQRSCFGEWEPRRSTPRKGNQGGKVLRGGRRSEGEQHEVDTRGTEKRRRKVVAGWKDRQI